MEPQDAAVDNSAADAAATVETSAAVHAAEVEMSEVEMSAQALAQIDAALAVLTDGSAAHVALQAQRADAVAALEVAQTAAATLAAKDGEIEQVRSLTLPAETIAALVAAIEARYAPVPEVAPEVAPTAAPTVGPRQPSERSIAANAAAAVDPELRVRADTAYACFDRDSAKLACSVNRRPNTRFSGMVALAMSGAGVANWSDYDRLTRAIRAYLIEVKGWIPRAGDGQSTPVAPWLASVGRYSIGSGVASALACFHSGAEIALYPDGRFRFALPNTPNVRYLRTDAAAYAAFTGSGAQSAATAPQSAPSVPTAPKAPTPPTAPTAAPVAPQSAPDAPTISRTARCQHCATKNIVGMPECASCGSTDWLLA